MKLCATPKKGMDIRSRETSLPDLNFTDDILKGIKCNI